MLGEEIVLRLPNQLTIHTLGNLLRTLELFPALPSKFVVEFHPKTAFFHPMTLSMLAAWADYWTQQGVPIECRNTCAHGIRYAARMRLFEHLPCRAEFVHAEREQTGKFVPITRLTTQNATNAFLAEIPPLLHHPDQTDAVRACLSELVKNVFEHAGEVPAFACAQYYPKARRISIGVADCGVGLRYSLSRCHRVSDDREALYYALTPGITGTIRSLYGGTDNAGGGLFYTKSIAHASGEYFAIVSGGAGFRLRRRAGRGPFELQRDPSQDVHDAFCDFSPWRGTTLGVDIGLFTGDRLQEIVGMICSHMVRTRKRPEGRFT